MDKKNRVKKIIQILETKYPKARCALRYNTPLQLLVATILSAQCTDERVNQVTPKLFAKYPDAESLAKAPLSDLEEIIRPTGFYRNKARAIQESCKKIVQEFQGKVPTNMKDLLSLKGVARKTANVVLGNAFGIAEGIVVDTHVKRITQRLGLVSSKNPEKIERELMELVPKSKWIDFSHMLIYHGRETCTARSPKCGSCELLSLCPFGQKLLKEAS